MSLDYNEKNIALSKNPRKNATPQDHAFLGVWALPEAFVLQMRNLR